MTHKQPPAAKPKPRAPSISTQSTERPSIRPKQAAALLGVGLATLYRWQASRPDMPRARKLGPRTTVYDRTELLAWRDESPEAGNGSYGGQV